MSEALAVIWILATQNITGGWAWAFGIAIGLELLGLGYRVAKD